MFFDSPVLNIISTVVAIIFFTFSVILWGIFLYFILISVFGWKKKKELDPDFFKSEKSFAIIVAAHDEEAVIANAVKSLKRVNYPDSLYDIFVVADNCTDNTADIARAEGAYVCERYNDELIGKGHALEWMFKKLFKMDKEYDGICILDADNLVSKNFLAEMNKHLCLGHEAIQGYIDSKNPRDTWVSGNNSIAFWISNRFIQLPRYYIGLSNTLGGTGFVITKNLLEEFGWGATCLAEDLEFTLKLVLEGKKVYWAHNAIVYDEKPLTIKQSYRQRKRWMQGHFNCAQRFLRDMIKRTFRKKDLIALDMSIYLTQPVVVAINGIGMVVGFTYFIITAIIGSFTLATGLYAVMTLVLLYLSSIFVLLEGKLSWGTVGYLLLMPFYNLTWVPIIIHGFIKRNDTKWTHTLHTQVVEIEEFD